MRAPFWSSVRSCRWAIASLAFALPPLIGGTLFAANPASQRTSGEATRSAEALLEQALACEIDGRAEERDALLAKAEALAPDHPAIKWQQGMIDVDGEWTPVEKVAAAATSGSLVAEYVARRNVSEDTLQGNLALAQWCQERELFEQERAHWNRVLTFEPDHPRARARLGFVQIEGEWISREEIARAIAEEAKAQASIRKNGAGLKAVVEDLGSEHPAVRERAAAKIRAIRDAELIPLLERVVAGVSEEASFAVLEALAAMPEKEASLAIARFAVLSPSAKVSVEAEGLLKNRSFDHYVPQMIASMRMPGRTELSWYRNVYGQLVYRRALYVEALNSIDVAIRDTVYRGTARADLGPILLGEFGADMTAEAQAALRDFKSREIMDSAFDKVADAGRVQLNARLGSSLESITGERLGADAEKWWNWWSQHNERMTLGQKPIHVQYGQRTVQVPTSTDVKVALWQIHMTRISCFAAGTPVLINRGEVAIEQVRIGDLVLAQDVETGELAFKPVLETTVRPPAELLRVEHEKGSFRCTGGHPFWVAGEGWVHARRLRSGMELHSLDGSVRVSDVVADGAEETYNLIVADFANYFVGDARILSHDNSSRRPTDAIVPGLAQK